MSYSTKVKNTYEPKKKLWDQIGYTAISQGHLCTFSPFHLLEITIYKVFFFNSANDMNLRVCDEFLMVERVEIIIVMSLWSP